MIEEPARRWGMIEHPGEVAGAAMIALAGSYAIAVQRPVPDWELRLTELINGLPDGIADVLYPIMQLGTLGGPIVVAAGIAVFRRDWLLSGATIVAGLVTWFSAKGVKRVVERDRPLGFLPDLVVREGDGSGLGYVSGHSAVAATAAVLAASVLPGRWKLIPVMLAFLVGIARVVHGVHLPADLVGGWAMGVLIGLATLAAVDQVRRRVAT